MSQLLNTTIIKSYISVYEKAQEKLKLRDILPNKGTPKCCMGSWSGSYNKKKDFTGKPGEIKINFVL